MHRDINIAVGGPINADYPKVYQTKFIKPGILFALQVTEPNTKYVIKHKIDLGGDGSTVNNVDFTNASIHEIGGVEFYYVIFTANGKPYTLLDDSCVFITSDWTGLSARTITPEEGTLFMIGSVTGGLHAGAYINADVITMPENCVLEFDGGKISNGVVVFNKTIVTGKGHIFDSVTMFGTLMNDSVYLSWFGAKGDGVNDDTSAFQQAVDFLQNKQGYNYKKLLLDGTTYKVTDTVDFKRLSHVTVTSYGSKTLDTPGAAIVSYVDKPIFRIRFVGVNVSGIGFTYDSNVVTTENAICILVKSVDSEEELPESGHFEYTDNDACIEKCSFSNCRIGINYWGVQVLIRDNNFDSMPNTGGTSLSSGTCIKINEFTRCTREPGGARCYRIWNNSIHGIGYKNIFIHNDTIYNQEGVVGAYGFSIQNNFCDAWPRFFVGNLIKSTVTGNYRNQGGNACVITADIIEDSIISGNYFEARSPAIPEEFWVNNVDGYEIHTHQLKNTIISDNSFSKVMFAQIYSDLTINTIISNNRFKSGYCEHIPKNTSLSVEYQTEHHSDDLGERWDFVTDIFLGITERGTQNVVITGNSFVLNDTKYFVAYDSWHSNPLVYTGNNYSIENNAVLPTDSNGIPQQVRFVYNRVISNSDNYAYEKNFITNNTIFSAFNFSDPTKHLESGIYIIPDVRTHTGLPDIEGIEAMLIVYCIGQEEVRELIPRRYATGIAGFIQKVGDSGVSRWTPICTAVWKDEMEAEPISELTGICVFDRTLNKPVWWTGITELGDNGWVDALGNHPDTVYPKVIGTPTAGNLAKFNSTDSYNIEDAGVAPQVE